MTRDEDEDMRRSFKVATVFTGAAALAGGYGPTALATTAQPAAVHPDITPAGKCGANNGGISNWVHFFYLNDNHPAMCIGGKGGEPINGTIYSFCPGNNGGVIEGSDAGIPASFHFHPGEGRAAVTKQYYYPAYSSLFHVDWITISTANGTAKCT